MTGRVRVLVVDDSATMRGIIAATLADDPDIEVVGQASDPFQGREAIKRLRPDVITLDVEMPNMNGIDFLERLMRLRPTPVIMISSLTHAGAEASIRALELGAFDCVGKPRLGNSDAFADLAAKVKMAAKSRCRATRPAAVAPLTCEYAPDGRVVAIGASTGGVEALTAVLSRFPHNCPPTIVTQHMPPMFTRTFAERLDRLCAPTVKEACDGDPILAGHIYLAPGGMHLEVANAGTPRCRLKSSDRVNGHCPSVDVMFGSVAKMVGARAVGIILTGMGRDGAEGLLAMRAAGAHTLGQDQTSSVIYGMPRTAHEIGAVCQQFALGRIGERIIELTNASSRRDGQ